MFHQWIYVSSAQSEITRDELESILAVSRKNNPPLEVTGLLMFKSGLFVQILEGPHANVKALYKKIELDQRHSSVRLVWESSTSQRAFGDWAMAYRDYGELELPWVNHLLKLEQVREETIQTLMQLKKLL
jgi:hypothetical protein